MRHFTTPDRARRSSFQSTHPLRGATVRGNIPTRGDKISIHAPLAGCDYLQPCIQRVERHFNPRTPCGVRLGRQGVTNKLNDFNPRTPCGVRLSLRTRWASLTQISIHAPLAGCDTRQRVVHFLVRCISIHAPLAGCDTLRGRHHDGHLLDFNPRTPCGVRLGRGAHRRAHGDFNPRTPCGVRPTQYAALGLSAEISIHAPLAGCDPHLCKPRTHLFHFNPRTPCGVRRLPPMPIASM